jgi:hypothetical protein
MDNDVLHKEIDLIQACITRMASNSFLLKGWAVSIIAVILALADKALDPVLLSAVVLIPLFSFWYLDAFFLRAERMYRKMYEWVIEKRCADDNSHLYDLNPHRFESAVESTRRTMWSITLRWFYGIPTVITLGVIALRICRKCGGAGI